MKKNQILLLVVGVIILVVGAIVVTNNRTSSTNVSPTPSVAMTTENPLTPEEESQILAASTEIVKANTEEGYSYSLAIKKRVGDYVRVDVTPDEGEMLDPAQVILEKKDGVWTATTFGTAFPELYDKVPELFGNDNQ